LLIVLLFLTYSDSANNARLHQSTSANRRRVPKHDKPTKEGKVNKIVTVDKPPLPERKCLVKFRDERMAFCNFVNLANGGNFGDELGPVVAEKLVENLFGCSAQNITRLNLKFDEGLRLKEKRVCLFTLGSVFHKVRSGDHIWGTGMNPNRRGAFPSNITIYAVRGKLTEELVRKRLNHQNAISLGDPGLAIPTLFPEFQTMHKVAKAKANSTRFCFVPHAHDTTTAKRQLGKRMRIIPVFQHWRPVVETLATECDYVASTSLHGIIESDALRIPTLWFQWNNSTVSQTEGQFKYLDYFSAVDKNGFSPVSDISQVLNVSAYARKMSKAELKEWVMSMKGSFPYHLFETTYENIKK